MIRRAWYVTMLTICSIVVGTDVGLAVSVASADDEPDFEILKVVAAARAENIEGLATWQGRATLTWDRRFESGELDSYFSFKSDFAYDRSTDSARWGVLVDERRYNLAVAVSDPVTPDNPEFFGGMVKGDLHYRFAPGEITKDGEKLNTLVIVPRQGQRIEGFSTDFHPMWYLAHYGQDINDELLYAYTNREILNTAEIRHSISRQANVIVWEKQSEAVVNRFHFDLSKGGSLLRYEAQNEKKAGREVWEWQWENYSGVWLPSALEYNSSGRLSDGTFSSNSVHVEFLENRVNEPLHEDEFSVEHLGVKRGTLVSDNIAGISYRYGEPVADDRHLPRDLLNPDAPTSAVALEAAAAVIPRAGKDNAGIAKEREAALDRYFRDLEVELVPKQA
jgi:hypothetical protein